MVRRRKRHPDPAAGTAPASSSRSSRHPACRASTAANLLSVTSRTRCGWRASASPTSTNASAPIYSAERRVATTILSAPGDIQIHLRARARTAAEARVIAESLGAKIQDELGRAVYTLADEPLEAVVAGLLREKGLKLAAAESCTGGLLAGKITAVPGSSEFFAGSLVSYSEQAKIDWLGVDAAILEAHGAVSEPAAAAMAQAARGCAAQALGSPAIGIATTGIAGPAGATEENPVGTVYFGIADDNGVVVKRRQLGAGRDRVRALAVQTGLDLIRRRVLGLPVSA